MELGLIIVFWAALAGMLWTYAGYPVAMRLWARWRPCSVRTGAAAGAGRTAVLMASHGEGARLLTKLQELSEAARTEPIHDIWVGLDGEEMAATPGLLEWVTAQSSLVHVRAFPEQRGKPSVLNALMAEAQEADIFIMMDVRQRVEAGAVSRLLEPFADESVGVVSGELVYESPDGGVQKGAQSYWAYEKNLRAAESRVWAVPGATGALYAIRRALCRPFPADTLDDDVLLPMRAVLAGKRCLFQPGAVAWDAAQARFDREGRRKRRTLAGIWQLLRLEPRLLSPVANPIWGRFLSHKVMRLWTPFLSFFLLVTSAGLCGLSGHWLWKMACGLVAGGGALSALSVVLARYTQSRGLGFLGTAWTLHVVLLQAAWDAVRGAFDAKWKT